MKSGCDISAFGYLEIFGNWKRGVSLGYHNIHAVAGPRIKSINMMGVELTPLGRLVRSAKYDADPDASALLCSLAVQSALAHFTEACRVYYVPMRDSSAGLTQDVARAVAAAITPGLDALAAFSWAQFPTFKKGAELTEIVQMTRTTDAVPRAVSACLLIDDTVWSGSTLALGALRLACVHSIVNVLSLSVVRVTE